MRFRKLTGLGHRSSLGDLKIADDIGLENTPETREFFSLD